MERRLKFKIAGSKKGSEQSGQPDKVVIVGVGGGGCNTVSTITKKGVQRVETIAINTDRQVLYHVDENGEPHIMADKKLIIGERITGGKGAGGNPEVGRNSAEESRNQIEELLRGADLCFLTAGEGGGTGTGAIPVVAKIAKDLGCLTIAVVTKPFSFEGRLRMERAEAGIAELSEKVDGLIVIPNDRILHIVDKNTSALDAFDKINEVLYNAIRSISDITTGVGFINVDFEDLKNIMQRKGKALIGMGVGEGEDKIRQALNAAINSPLLENYSIEGATGVLINFTGGPDIPIIAVNEAAMEVKDRVHPDADIFFGLVIDKNMGDKVKVTVIATGFEEYGEYADEEEEEEEYIDTSNESSGVYAIKSGYEPVEKEDYSQYRYENESNTKRGRLSKIFRRKTGVSASVDFESPYTQKYKHEMSEWEEPAFTRRLTKNKKNKKF